MKKRGQITIFMVIGIILLFSTSLVFYIKNEVRESQLDVESFRVERVSEELKPVKNFVEACLKQIGEEAVRLVGANGGYIDIKKQGFNIDPFSLDSEVIVFEPDIIPFWYYTDRADNFMSKMPKLYMATEGDNSIEDQMDLFIEQNLKRCLRNFTSFKSTYNINTGEMFVRTTVTEDNVMLQLVYPLEIITRSSGDRTRMSKFFTFLEVDLEEVYEFINDTIALEVDRAFMEKPIKTLINIYQDKDGLFPEFGEMSTSAKIKVWIRFELEELIKNELLPMLQLIQIMDTRNPKTVEVPDFGGGYHSELQGLYHGFNLMMGKNYSGVNAEFFYPGTPIYFSVGGKEVIMPHNAIPDWPVISFILPQILEYPKGYDLSYPLVLQVEQPDAFDGEGYRFQVALEANIRNSFPYTATEGLTVAPREITSLISPSTPYLFVDKEITVETKNRNDLSALPGVDIAYQCGEKVSVGTTDIKDGRAVLTAKMPYCALGGRIIASRDGYMGKVIRFNNKEDNEDSFEISMYPIVKKVFNIRKRNTTHIYNLTNMLISPNDKPRMLREQSARVHPQERVIFNIQKIKEDPSEDNFPMLGFFDYKMPDYTTVEVSGATKLSPEEQMEQIRNIECGELTADECDQMKQDILEGIENKQEHDEEAGPPREDDIPDFFEMDMVPGDYSINAKIMYNGEIEIKEKVLEDLDADDDECDFACETGKNKEDELCCIEGMTLDMWVRGGVEYIIRIPKEIVYSDKNISFYLLDFGLPETYDDMGSDTDMANASMRYKDILGVTFDR